jgi:hypothetical protein
VAASGCDRGQGDGWAGPAARQQITRLRHAAWTGEQGAQKASERCLSSAAHKALVSAKYT